MKSMEYLSFTKRERAGIIALVILLLLFAVAPKFACQPKPVAVNISAEQLKQLTGPPKYYGAYKKDSTKIHPGKKYPSYPVHERRYVAYQKGNDNSNRVGQARASRFTSRPAIRVIDINEADTTALIALPGIGSKLASRIVLFREKLGGFYSVAQIGEVYGLSDSVFKKILPLLTCTVAQVRKLDINRAGKDELKQHPYIRWQRANALIEYRNQHGQFDSLSDLANINNIDSGALSKMMPYLAVY